MGDLERTEDSAVILAGNTFGMGEALVTPEDKLGRLLSFISSMASTVEEARDTIGRLRNVIEQVHEIAEAGQPDALERILNLTKDRT